MASAAINPDTRTGTTVRELLDAFNGVAAVPIETRDAPRRPGDIAGAYTRTDRAARLLGWQPRLSIADGIRACLRWAAIRDAVPSEYLAPAGFPRPGHRAFV